MAARRGTFKSKLNRPGLPMALSRPTRRRDLALHSLSGATEAVSVR